MAEAFYRVTIGAHEASTWSPLTSNRLLVDLVCGVHADLVGSDPEVAACEVARKVMKREFSKWEEPGYLVAEKLDGVTASDFSVWSTLDCGCRAVVTPNC